MNEPGPALRDEALEYRGSIFTYFFKAECVSYWRRIVARNVVMRERKKLLEIPNNDGYPNKSIF